MTVEVGERSRVQGVRDSVDENVCSAMLNNVPPLTRPFLLKIKTPI